MYIIIMKFRISSWSLKRVKITKPRASIMDLFLILEENVRVSLEFSTLHKWICEYNETYISVSAEAMGSSTKMHMSYLDGSDLKLYKYMHAVCIKWVFTVYDLIHLLLYLKMCSLFQVLRSIHGDSTFSGNFSLIFWCLPTYIWHFQWCVDNCTWILRLSVDSRW